MQRAAVGTTALFLGGIKGVEERRQVLHQALQLGFHTVYQVPATILRFAIPLEAVLQALGPLALNDQAYAVGFGALRRVPDVRGQQKDIALFQVQPFTLTIYPKVQIGVAPQLIKEFFQWIVVVVGTAIGTTHHGDQKVAVLPDLLVAYRGLEQMGVLIDPALEVERFAV